MWCRLLQLNIISHKGLQSLVKRATIFRLLWILLQLSGWLRFCIRYNIRPGKGIVQVYCSKAFRKLPTTFIHTNYYFVLCLPLLNLWFSSQLTSCLVMGSTLTVSLPFSWSTVLRPCGGEEGKRC